MKESIKNLLRPRTLFAALFYVTFCSLIILQKEVPESLIAIVTSLMTFYYTKKLIKGGTNVADDKKTIQ